MNVRLPLKSDPLSVSQFLVEISTHYSRLCDNGAIPDVEYMNRLSLCYKIREIIFKNDPEFLNNEQVFDMSTT